MAVIYTDLFLDQKTGIAKFSSVVTKLNGEFAKLKEELTQMQNRAQALETEINKLRDAPAGTPIDQKSLQAKIDQLEQLLKMPYYLSPGWLKIDPAFDPLRKHPRFQRLVEGTA